MRCLYEYAYSREKWYVKLICQGCMACQNETTDLRGSARLFGRHGQVRVKVAPRVEVGG